jgi:hypothetical protein
MCLGQRGMQGQTSECLAGIGTGEFRPYHPYVCSTRSIASSNNFTSCRWKRDLRYTTTINTETPPLDRFWGGTWETSFGLLHRSSEDKASSPSPSITTSLSPSPIPFSFNHSCDLDCYCVFVFEFIPLLSFHP